MIRTHLISFFLAQAHGGGVVFFLGMEVRPAAVGVHGASLPSPGDPSLGHAAQPLLTPTLELLDAQEHEKVIYRRQRHIEYMFDFRTRVCPRSTTVGSFRHAAFLLVHAATNDDALDSASLRFAAR